MKKGSVLNILAGTLEILFGIGFIAVLVLTIIGNENSVGGGLMTPIVYFFSSIFKDEILGAIIYSLYSSLIVDAIFTICFIVYGSVTISFMKRETGEFYKKKKSMIFFLVSSCLAFAYCLVSLIITLSAEAFDSLTFALTLIIGAALVLRIIGLISYFHGMKLAPKATEEDKYFPQLNEYNDSSVDLITKLKRLNTMKETGVITEKEYDEIKVKLLGENNN